MPFVRISLKANRSEKEGMTAERGFRKEDVFVNLLETPREN